MNTKILTPQEYGKSVELANIAARECTEYLIAGNMYQAKICADIYLEEKLKQKHSLMAT